ncbi:MAG TPA: EamA family transporter [Candidatus Acidoferrales bacterium]|nr:EamA family transporter [Candidatus Acidoferrales bacterium]
MTARDAISLGIIILAGTGGELCVTHTMKRIGEVTSFYPHHLLRVILRAFRSGWMWIGLALMTLSFFSLLMLLSWENVSFVVPVTALSYVFGAFGGKFLLGERIEARRWLGVLLVCLGVLLVCIG